MPTLEDALVAHTPWEQARRRAGRVADPLPSTTRRLADALHHALAEPLTSLADLPVCDGAAMDGWAVAGPGPWTVLAGGVLASDRPEPLRPGAARRIATGAPLPAGASAVLRLEHGTVAGDVLRGPGPAPGRDVRRRGQECERGERLLTTGTTVTPGVLGLAAATGHDVLNVHRMPTVRLLVTGAELVDAGVPGPGMVRDALSPLLEPALRVCGTRPDSVRYLGDDRAALAAELAGADVDVLITTGGTAVGPTDAIHGLLGELDARLVVDGVGVRPGHPMLLAELPPTRPGRRRRLVGLPGNPLAAVAGLLTLALPLLRRLGGHDEPGPRLVRLDQAVGGHHHDVRLVPVALQHGGAVPLGFTGPAMLRGVALADALAVVPPGGARTGDPVELLNLPR